MRVISALKGLAEENDLENYLNTEEIIRYFVAHNFVLNYDSYTGNMLPIITCMKMMETINATMGL